MRGEHWDPLMLCLLMAAICSLVLQIPFSDLESISWILRFIFPVIIISITIRVISTIASRSLTDVECWSLVHFTVGPLGKTPRLHSFDVFFHLTSLELLHFIASMSKHPISNVRVTAKTLYSNIMIWKSITFQHSPYVFCLSNVVTFNFIACVCLFDTFLVFVCIDSGLKSVWVLNVVMRRGDVSSSREGSPV